MNSTFQVIFSGLSLDNLALLMETLPRTTAEKPAHVNQVTMFDPDC